MDIPNPSLQGHMLPRQLPVLMNVTIGRTGEIATLSALLRRHDVRLLTLTGTGGVGKTRLAVEVAREVSADFRDGVCFVSLAPLQEPEMVLAVIAQSLGVEEVPHYPLFECLKAYVQDKHLLLALDNFEHVLAAGPLIADLLAIAPHLKILATSREVLHLYGEREFEVLPLALPDLSEDNLAMQGDGLTRPINTNLGEVRRGEGGWERRGGPSWSPVAAKPRPKPTDRARHTEDAGDPRSRPAGFADMAALALFVERAQAVRPSFALTDENVRAVAEICVQLDGLPLAIELAAARIKLLTPQSILSRLQSRLSFLTGGARNLPARQQTLRNTLNWSHDLLSATEQHFFRSIGVLVGNWSLEAADAVYSRDTPCGYPDGVGYPDGAGYPGEGGYAQPLELLTSLVDKSLVRVVEDSGETRFMLLETIREYALDSLEKHGESDEVRKRHAEYYLKLAEEAEPALYGSGQRASLERLDRETNNLWAAMRWVITSKNVEIGLRLASALNGFLQMHGSLSDGHNWLEEVLALDEGGSEGESETARLNAWRARVLYGSGNIALMRSNLVLARSRLEESHTRAARAEDRRTQALASGVLAMLELYQDNYEAARSFAEAGSLILKETDDRWCKGILYSVHGQIESRLCNFDRARTRFHVSLMLLRDVGDLNNQAAVLVHLGNIMRLQGKLKTAHFLYTKSLGLFQEIGDRWSQSICLTGMGEVLRLQGHYDEAQARFEECLVLTTALGNRQVRAVALTGLGQIALYRGEMKLAARYMKESLRLLREIEHTPSLIFLLLGLGDLERSQGNGEAAIAYYEQCLALTRTANDKVSMAGALFGLGDVAREQQKYARACMLLKQSIQLAWDVGDRLGMVATLETFAWLSRQIGLPERAAQFLGTVEGLRDWLQIPLPPTFHTNHEHEVAVLRNELGESLFHELWAYGRTMTLKLALSMVARISVPEQSDTPTGKEAPTYPAGLTAREVDVLRLVAAGLPDARIAEQLVISPRTVNTHLRSIYAKLGVSSRSAATRFAFEQNLV